MPKCKDCINCHQDDSYGLIYECYHQNIRAMNIYSERECPHFCPTSEAVAEQQKHDERMSELQARIDYDLSRGWKSGYLYSAKDFILDGDKPVRSKHVRRNWQYTLFIFLEQMVFTAILVVLSILFARNVDGWADTVILLFCFGPEIGLAAAVFFICHAINKCILKGCSTKFYLMIRTLFTVLTMIVCIFTIARTFPREYDGGTYYVAMYISFIISCIAFAIMTFAIKDESYCCKRLFANGLRPIEESDKDYLPIDYVEADKGVCPYCGSFYYYTKK